MHGALEFAAGFAIAVMPIVVGVSAPAAALAFLIGALLMGAATGATVSDTPGQAFSVAGHAAFDRIVAGVLFALGLGAVLAGDLPAAAFFLAAGLVQGTLMALTRYAAPDNA